MTEPVVVIETVPPPAVAFSACTKPLIDPPPDSWVKSIPPVPLCVSVIAFPDGTSKLAESIMSTLRSVAPCAHIVWALPMAPWQMKWPLPDPCSEHPTLTEM